MKKTAHTQKLKEKKKTERRFTWCQIADTMELATYHSLVVDTPNNYPSKFKAQSIHFSRLLLKIF